MDSSPSESDSTIARRLAPELFLFCVETSESVMQESLTVGKRRCAERKVKDRVTLARHLLVFG